MWTLAELRLEYYHFHSTTPASRIQTFIFWVETIPKPMKGLRKTSSMCFADRHFKKSCLDPNCSKWCLFTLIAVIGRRGLVSNETQTMELDTAKLENSLHSVLAMWSWASYETSLIPSIIIHRMKPEMCLRGVVGIRYNNPHAVLHTVTGVGGML